MASYQDITLSVVRNIAAYLRRLLRESEEWVSYVRSLQLHLL
jgi:hypothetical protein